MISTLAYVLWIVNLALDTTGQITLKLAATRAGLSQGPAYWQRVIREPLAWLGIACYVVEFATWLAFVTLVPLSVAVLLASVNVITVAIAGRLLFAEPAGSLRTAGILLIALGVAVVGWGGA